MARSTCRSFDSNSLRFRASVSFSIVVQLSSVAYSFMQSMVYSSGDLVIGLRLPYPYLRPLRVNPSLNWDASVLGQMQSVTPDAPGQAAIRATRSVSESVVEVTPTFPPSGPKLLELELL